MKGLKIVETLKVTFTKKLNEDQTMIKTAYFNNKTSKIVNIDDINKELKLPKQEIITTMGKMAIRKF